MQWIKILDRKNVRDQLPKDRAFLALWKGAFSLVEFDEAEDAFYISYFPAQYSGGFKLEREREGKITHFCNLELPEDY